MFYETFIQESLVTGDWVAASVFLAGLLSVVLCVLGSALATVLDFIDDFENNHHNPYAKFIALKVFREKCYTDGDALPATILGAFAAMAAVGALHVLDFFPLFVAVIGVLLLLVLLARKIKRLNKKFNAHVKDKAAHK